MTSDWGPPPPPRPGGSAGGPPEPPLGGGAPIYAGSPRYLLGTLTGGAVVGVMTALFSCCCTLVIGWLGGGISAWAARQRSSVFGLKEGAYAGFLTALVATLAFSLVYIPVTITNGSRIQRQGLNQAERNLVQQFPMISEQQLIDQAIANSSPAMIALMVVLNGGVFFVTCVIGGMGVGAAFPKAGEGLTPPAPPHYHHPHGPPPGVPEPYAAPGFNDQPEPPPETEAPRHSTAWKEISPEELALPITLEDDDPQPEPKPGLDADPETEPRDPPPEA